VIESEQHESESEFSWGSDSDSEFEIEEQDNICLTIIMNAPLVVPTIEFVTQPCYEQI
jgi:hypothetical protein